MEQYRRVVRRLADGTLFIDRDGELFAYILDYMRNGKLLLPDNFHEMARLREEVLFYQLNGLMEQLAPYYNLRYPSKAALVAQQSLQLLHQQPTTGNNNGQSQQQQQQPNSVQTSPQGNTGTGTPTGICGTSIMETGKEWAQGRKALLLLHPAQV